jgi:ubiquinone/menaquinone biosynthesis methyltransferase
MQTAPIPEVAKRRSHEGEHTDSVRSMFDRIAPTYDTLNRLLSFGIDTRWRKRAVRELDVKKNDDVLDLCAGTLDLSKMIADAHPNANITAGDFSREMLERGKDKAPTAKRVVCDAMAMPFEDSAFSRVICGFGIRNVADTKKAASEILRVLRPGGIFVTLEFFRPTRLRAKAFHAAYANAVLPNVGALVSGDRKAYAYLKESMKGFASRAEYESLLKNAGFVNVRGFDLLIGIASIVIGVKGQPA